VICRREGAHEASTPGAATPPRERPAGVVGPIVGGLVVVLGVAGALGFYIIRRADTSGPAEQATRLDPTARLAAEGTDGGGARAPMTIRLRPRRRSGAQDTPVQEPGPPGRDPLAPGPPARVSGPTAGSARRDQEAQDEREALAARRRMDRMYQAAQEGAAGQTVDQVSITMYMTRW